jgi:hypothetical protein
MLSRELFLLNIGMQIFEIELTTDMNTRGDSFKLMLKDWFTALKRAKSIFLGTVGKFQIFGIDDPVTKDRLITAIDGKTPAVLIQLSHYTKGASNCFETQLITADEQYRGINLPTKIYAFLIREKSFILISCANQSLGAQHIWSSLAKESGIGVYGYNIKTHKVFQVDMKDLFNEDIYDTELNKEIQALYDELEDIPWLDKNRDETNVIREKEIDKEIAKLEKVQSETREDVRLFAARSR